MGLGRTGTLSLCHALETLGFGPCHHPLVAVADINWGDFGRAARDHCSPQILDNLYQGYVSAVDNTAAMLAEPLYRTFPDAKYILTVRDPAKWTESMRNTILRNVEDTRAIKSKLAEGTATEADKRIFEKLEKVGMFEYDDAFRNTLHKGLLETDTEGAIIRHNQFVMEMIPQEKLLVFNVAEGWEPLANFLGVPVPNEPFPRLNESAEFLKSVAAQKEKN